jgi:hypothetical protein
MSVEQIMQQFMDEQTTEDILALFEFSSTGSHLSEELKDIASALAEATRTKIAQTFERDEQLSIARQARAAWHKALRAASEAHAAAYELKESTRNNRPEHATKIEPPQIPGDFV